MPSLLILKPLVRLQAWPWIGVLAPVLCGLLWLLAREKQEDGPGPWLWLAPGIGAATCVGLLIQGLQHGAGFVFVPSPLGASLQDLRFGCELWASPAAALLGVFIYGALMRGFGRALKQAQGSAGPQGDSQPRPSFIRWLALFALLPLALFGDHLWTQAMALLALGLVAPMAPNPWRAPVFGLALSAALAGGALIHGASGGGWQKGRYVAIAGPHATLAKQVGSLPQPKGLGEEDTQRFLERLAALGEIARGDRKVSRASERRRKLAASKRRAAGGTTSNGVRPKTNLAHLRRTANRGRYRVSGLNFPRGSVTGTSGGERPLPLPVLHGIRAAGVQQVTISPGIGWEQVTAGPVMIEAGDDWEALGTANTLSRASLSRRLVAATENGQRLMRNSLLAARFRQQPALMLGALATLLAGVAWAMGMSAQGGNRPLAAAALVPWLSSFPLASLMTGALVGKAALILGGLCLAGILWQRRSPGSVRTLASVGLAALLWLSNVKGGGLECLVGAVGWSLLPPVVGKRSWPRVGVESALVALVVGPASCAVGAYAHSSAWLAALVTLGLIGAVASAGMWPAEGPKEGADRPFPRGELAVGGVALVLSLVSAPLFPWLTLPTPLHGALGLENASVAHVGMPSPVIWLLALGLPWVGGWMARQRKHTSVPERGAEGENASGDAADEHADDEGEQAESAPAADRSEQDEVGTKAALEPEPAGGENNSPPSWEGESWLDGIFAPILGPAATVEPTTDGVRQEQS